MIPPPPGIYPGVPADLYHAWDCASSHRLGLFTGGKSGRWVRFQIDNPGERSAALVLGDTLHAALLQPDVFAREYAVAPLCDRRYKEGKAKWDAFMEANSDKRIVKAAEFAACEAMARAVLANPGAAKLLGDPAGAVELSAVWDVSGPGFVQRCKLRADKLAPTHGAIVDVKTTDDASPEAFEASARKYGYHRQAAMYLRGLAALGMPFEHYTFIVVEKDPPHEVAVYRLDDTQDPNPIDVGWAECLVLLDLYAAAERDGWPSYPKTIQTISLPDWFLRRQTRSLSEAP